MNMNFIKYKKSYIGIIYSPSASLQSKYWHQPLKKPISVDHRAKITTSSFTNTMSFNFRISFFFKILSDLGFFFNNLIFNLIVLVWWKEMLTNWQWERHLRQWCTTSSLTRQSTKKAWRSKYHHVSQSFLFSPLSSDSLTLSLFPSLSLWAVLCVFHPCLSSSSLSPSPCL